MLGPISGVRVKAEGQKAERRGELIDKLDAHLAACATALVVHDPDDEVPRPPGREKGPSQMVWTSAPSRPEERQRTVLELDILFFEKGLAGQHDLLGLPLGQVERI
jgi:hypothetical protein